MMTKKNFIAIAKAFSDWQQLPFTQSKELKTLANFMAAHFERDNPQFDRAKFMAAAGFKE